LVAGLLAAATSLAVAADTMAQGSSSSGGTSSRGTGSGSPSTTAPTPTTPQSGTASPGTSPSGTTSQGDRGTFGSSAPGDTSGGTIGSPSPGPTTRTPAPNIVDRSRDPAATRGRGTANLATLPPAQIQALQSALNRAGVSVAVDGQAGPETQRALQQYQRDNGLAVTGELDDQTRARLDLGG
jgi:peptidoglycan hydrolase-like protein with peptidoglycan-binding domain